jgi:hypothetical protein
MTSRTKQVKIFKEAAFDKLDIVAARRRPALRCRPSGVGEFEPSPFYCDRFGLGLSDACPQPQTEQETMPLNGAGV